MMKAPKGEALLAVTILASSGLSGLAQGGGGRGASAPSPYPTVSGKAYKFEEIAEGVYYATSTGTMTPEATTRSSSAIVT